ncbi:MAG TPA: hypothetical protein VNT56_05505 [Acidimicrobiales bacterium]|nr:hypothetical protein [Acidimicrobiales bacterium]
MRLKRRSGAHLDEDGSTPRLEPEANGASPEPAPASRRVLRATRVEDDRTGEEPAVAAGGGDPPAAPGASPPDRPRKGRLRALLDEQVSQSREESLRQAAEELRQFMEPARQQLVLNVPGSSSPEEAEATLNHQAAGVLASPVPARPEAVIDLRNPSSMRAYPPEEKLSNRVLRLADRHWTRPKPRSSADIVAEKSAIAEREFARKPAGTQRCQALRGSLRCRGVFAFRHEEQEDGSILACPTCGSAHVWNPEAGQWTLASEGALATAAPRSSLPSGD